MAVRQRDQAILLAKLQDSIGVVPTFDPTTDAIQISNVDINFRTDTVARDIIKQTLGASGEVVTATYVELTFTVELKGSGYDGTNVIEPRILRLLQACGYKKNVITDPTAGNTIGYSLNPSSDEFGTVNRPACAFQLFNGISGNQADEFVIADAAGDYRINFQVGQFPTVEFTFQGRLVSGPTTVTIPTNVAYENTMPNPCVAANVTIDNNNTFVTTQVTINSGNEINMRQDMNATDGYISAFMGTRRITASIDPEATLASDYDWINKLKSGALASLSIGPIGADIGNKVSISAPQAQYTGISQGDRNGILVYNVDLLLTEVNGDDEIEIKFE